MTEINSQPGTLVTGKSKRQLALEARKEQLDILNKIRLELHKGLEELEELGGDDDVKGSILAIVRECKEGILQTKLCKVLPDADALLRKALVKEGLITEEKSGQTWLLKAVVPTEENATK